MSPCIDHRRHELVCEHHKEFRWRSADGCSGYVCADCLMIVMAWPAEDHISAVGVDRDGSPVDRVAWTAVWEPRP
jgi:hypothetical protein